ncbi:MAG: hypothetical protein CSA58_02685 [Micrococcales bacterium]|nr:MAG: hypothetical protein CSA58_02685 [Micrococcales bacterium]
MERLADLAGMTPRNVRAYQQRGLLAPPKRSGRNAWYSWDHLARLRLVSALHEHGLTLKVIADLVERGAADAELARLDREELSATWAKSTRVPMAPGVAQWLTEDAKTLRRQLLDVGLIEERDGVLFASAAGLGVAAALSRRDVHPGRTAHIAVTVAAAAKESVQAILGHSETLGQRMSQDEYEEVCSLLMQFAATCFADVLRTQLCDQAAGDPPGSDARAPRPRRCRLTQSAGGATESRTTSRHGNWTSSGSCT